MLGQRGSLEEDGRTTPIQCSSLDEDRITMSENNVTQQSTSDVPGKFSQNTKTGSVSKAITEPGSVSNNSSQSSVEKWQLAAPEFEREMRLQYSVHAIPPRMLKELARVFVGADLTNGLVVPTFQVSVCGCGCMAK